MQWNPTSIAENCYMNSHEMCDTYRYEVEFE